MEMTPVVARNSPKLVWSPHPLLPSKDREIVYDELLPDESVEQYLDRIGMLRRMGDRPFILTINGHRVPRRMWRNCYPKPGTLINVYALVRGGSGGSKNPIATVMMIAVMVVAPYAAAGMMGMTTATMGMAGTLLSYGIMVAGGLAINAIFPPPKPELKNIQLEAESPTYSLTGGSNQVRRYQPLPYVVGTHKIFPDFGAIPFNQFEGEDQVSFYLFNYGYSDVALSDHKIGETSLDSFSGVIVEESGSDGVIDLFPGNIDTTDGGALTAAASWIERTTSTETNFISIEIVGSLFRLGDNGLENRTVIIEAQYRAVGSGTWIPLTFHSDEVPVPVWAGSGWIPSSIALFLNEYLRQLNAALPAGQFKISSESKKPVRRTYSFWVAQGQYEVRVRRLTPEETDVRVTSELVWTQLRSYQRDDGTYTGQKRLGLKIRASGQLSGTLQQFSSIATAQTQVWNGASWILEPTSNPAWWFLDCARGKFVAGELVWGAGLSDTRIDIEGLKAFGAWCDDQGLTVNAVFDTKKSVYEVLSALALAGRATISWDTGKLGVVWDAPNLPVTAHFGMHNIVAGTFEIEYATEELADVIEGEFINADNGYIQDVVRVVVPGATSEVNVRRIQLFGRTDRILAAEDTNLYAAQNAYRNRRYKWQCDWEGMPTSRGNVVELTHDLAALDYSGRFTDGGDVSTLKLSKSVPLYEAGSYILIKTPAGVASVHPVEGGAGETDTLTLITPLADFDPWNDADHPPYDYTWQYGSTATPGKLVKIEKFKPISDKLVELHAIDELSIFYTAKSNPYSYTPPVAHFGAVQISNLQLTSDAIRTANGYLVKVVITWQSEGDYEMADVKMAIGDAPFDVVGRDIRGNICEVTVSDGVALEIQVTAFGKLGRLGKSSKLSATATIDFAGSKDPADVTGFTATITSTQIILNWDEVPDADRDQYEVWYGPAFGSGVQIFLGKALEYRDTPKLVGAHNYHVKAIDVAGRKSLNATSITATVNAIAAPVVSSSIQETDVVLTWTTPALQFAVDTYEVRYGLSFDGGISLGKTKSTTLKVPITWLGDQTFWVAATDIAGQTGSAGSKTVSIAAPNAPSFSTTVITGQQAVLVWTAPASTLPIREYEIRHGASFAAGTIITRIKGTTHTLKVEWGGSRTFWVAAIDSNDEVGSAGSTSVSITVPSAPIISVQVVDNNVLLQWTDVTQTLPIQNYEIRRGETFATATVIGTVLAQFSVIFESASGTYKYWVVGIDTAGNYGTESSISSSVNQPPDYVLFDDGTSQLDSTEQTNWLRQQGAHYVIDLNGSTQYADVDSILDLDSGITGLTFEAWVVPGLASQNGGILEKTVGGAVNTCASLFIEGTTATMRVKNAAGSTIDADVSLGTFAPGTPVHLIGRWDGANVKININGGATTQTAAAITLGQGAGIFYVGRLATAGYYFNGGIGPCRVYKRAISDTEKNEHYAGIFKDETSLIAAWNFDEGSGDFVDDDTNNSYDLQIIGSPDWVLHALDGRNDLTIAAPVAYFPHYSNESVTEYIARTGYTTPNAATGAGYDGPLYPAPTTAQYVEEFDFGTVLAATKINFVLTDEVIVGTVTVTPTISVKLLEGDPWTDYPGLLSVFTTEFQYVKITLDITASGGNNVKKATQLNARLDVKLINDAGMVTCNAADAGGTQVNFNVSFVDVQSITVTPSGTTSVTAVYDFVDTPNPTGFKALLFNPATGARVSGDASWNVKGV